MTTTIASSDVTSAAPRPAGRVGALEEPGDGPARRQEHGCRATIRPPSMTRRRGSEVPVGVEQQDAVTMPKPSGRTTTTKSLCRGPAPAANPGRGRRARRPATPRCRGRRRDQLILRFARMKPMPSRSWATVEPIACSVTGLASSASPRSRPRGRPARRQREAEDGRDQVAGGDHEDQRLGPTVDDQRAQQREPEGERRVQGQGEDPVRGDSWLRGHEVRDHRRLGRREEGRDRRHEDVEQQDHQQVLPGQEQQPRTAPPAASSSTPG